MLTSASVMPETFPAPAIGMITQKIIVAMTATGTVAASMAELDHLGAMTGVISRAEIAATMDGGAEDVPNDASDISSVKPVPAQHIAPHDYRELKRSVLVGKKS
jgi:hypothetical protein